MTDEIDNNSEELLRNQSFDSVIDYSKKLQVRSCRYLAERLLTE